MIVAGRRWEDFVDPSRARTPAPSRAKLEPSLARPPHMAGCDFSFATLPRAAALHSKSTRSLGAYGAGQLPVRRPMRRRSSLYSSNQLAMSSRTMQGSSFPVGPNQRWRISPVVLSSHRTWGACRQTFIRLHSPIECLLHISFTMVPNRTYRTSPLTQSTQHGNNDRYECRTPAHRSQRKASCRRPL